MGILGALLAHVVATRLRKERMKGDINLEATRRRGQISDTRKATFRTVEKL